MERCRQKIPYIAVVLTHDDEPGASWTEAAFAMITQPYCSAVDRLRTERRRIIDTMINSDGAPTPEQLQEVARLREAIEVVDAVLEQADAPSMPAPYRRLPIAG